MARTFNRAVLALISASRTDGQGNGIELQVDLNGGDALFRSGDFEVHVAEVVLESGDVGQDDMTVAFLDQAHGDAGRDDGQRRAGVHQGEDAAADGGHGGRAVRFEDLGDDPDGVGELLLGRDGRKDGFFSQGAVADLPASGAAEEAGFADRERREVVMQHEPFLDFLAQAVQALGVLDRAQGDCGQGLGLPSGEQGRPVGPGKEARLRS